MSETLYLWSAICSADLMEPRGRKTRTTLKFFTLAANRSEAEQVIQGGALARPNIGNVKMIQLTSIPIESGGMLFDRICALWGTDYRPIVPHNRLTLRNTASMFDWLYRSR